MVEYSTTNGRRRPDDPERDVTRRRLPDASINYQSVGRCTRRDAATEYGIFDSGYRTVSLYS